VPTPLPDAARLIVPPNPGVHNINWVRAWHSGVNVSRQFRKHSASALQLLTMLGCFALAAAEQRYIGIPTGPPSGVAPEHPQQPGLPTLPV
jgi:hypothetical protein